MGRKILIVDDDANICDLVKMYLVKEGYETSVAYSGDEAVTKFRGEAPSLVILDLMLPKLDGWNVCRELKKISDIPIIMLTAKDDTFDKVLGLKMGADDYIVKPFEPRELVARVDAVLRRYHKENANGRQIVLPSLVIDLDQYKVRIKNEEMELPPKEIELLYFLAKNKNRVFTREQVIEQIWGIDFQGDNRTVDVHIKRLREKLEAVGEQYQIRTVWGVGYKFEVKTCDKYSF